MSPPYRLLLIGASAGGVTALKMLFDHLSPQFSPPIVIVQHLPRDSSTNLQLVYTPRPERKLIEAEDKMKLLPHSVYFAPTGYHLLVEADATLSLSVDEPVYYSRPSIDVLFHSAAQAYGPQAIGLLLTGANEDGAQGLKDLSDAGGITFVQNPRTAAYPIMPKAALSLKDSHQVLDLEEIPDALLNLVSGGGHG